MGSSLSREVYNTLLQQLLQNELIPGTILNRRKVAAELGVSVAPVLEAMLQLEMEGFLEASGRKRGSIQRYRTDQAAILSSIAGAHSTHRSSLHGHFSQYSSSKES